MTLGPTAISTTNISSIIARASAKTGADFDHLMATAQRESSLNPAAKSKTSSAAGLFQFVEQTWLDMVKRHGAKHGLVEVSASIERGESGRYKVADPKQKEEILALRHDPKAAAAMAGEYARETGKTLSKSLGRPLKQGELYIAHFMGSGAASKLINAAEKTPSVAAAELFPQAASANRSIFYGSSNVQQSVQSVYDKLVGKTAQQSQPSQASAFANSPHQKNQSITHAITLPPKANMLTPQILEILSVLDPLKPSERENKT